MQRILVVDDEEDLREILRFNLEAEGFEVETAASAEEALSAFHFFLSTYLRRNNPHVRIHNNPHTMKSAILWRYMKFKNKPTISPKEAPKKPPSSPRGSNLYTFFRCLVLSKELPLGGWGAYTLNLKCMMSPSCTTYSLPSMPSLPASLMAASDLYSR